MSTVVKMDRQKKRPVTFDSLEVKILVLRRFGTITALGRFIEYTRQYTSEVIHNHVKSRRAQERIARALGKRRPEDLAVRSAA
jgi:hypothetical protein